MRSILSNHSTDPDFLPLTEINEHNTHLGLAPWYILGPMFHVLRYVLTVQKFILKNSNQLNNESLDYKHETFLFNANSVKKPYTLITTATCFVKQNHLIFWFILIPHLALSAV